MKTFFVILLLTLALTLSIRAELPAGWGTNYSAAITATTNPQSPVLVYFTASWCGPCKLMGRLTLTDPDILDCINGIEHVAVDIDEHPDLAARHQVNAVPTFILLANADDEVERTTGFQAPADFMPWLTNGIAMARKFLNRQELARKTLAEVDQLLAATDASAIPQAAVKLFELCDARNSAVAQAAASRLKTVARRDLAALLDGLDDRRLATRIQVANALRQEIGDGFDVDPWSDAATRGKLVVFWREKLAKTPDPQRF